MRHKRLPFVFALVLCGAGAVQAQLPDGPGKQAIEKTCTECHEVDRVYAPRLDRLGWQQLIIDMQDQGLKADPATLNVILDYLATNLSPDAPPAVNINTATPIQLEAAFSLLRSEARTLVRYRREEGEIKDVEALKKVPGVDISKILAHKERLLFADEFPPVTLPDGTVVPSKKR